jgi:hypothetical protein
MLSSKHSHMLIEIQTNVLHVLIYIYIYIYIYLYIYYKIHKIINVVVR